MIKRRISTVRLYNRTGESVSPVVRKRETLKETKSGKSSSHCLLRKLLRYLQCRVVGMVDDVALSVLLVLRFTLLLETVRVSVV